MPRVLRGVVVAALVLVPALLAAPSVLAGTTTTSLVCYGGTSDRDARAVDAGRILGNVGTQSPAAAYWVTTNGWPVWEETNGKRGLQQEDEMCTERTLDEDGVIVASRTWVETPADTRVQG